MSHPFLKVRHARGYRVRSLWKRNGIFYVQIRMGGHSAKKIALPDCKTIPQALEALAKLKAQRKEGLAHVPARVPKFREYAANYLDSIDGDKRPATIEKETSCLAGWRATRSSYGSGETRLRVAAGAHPARGNWSNARSNRPHKYA